MSGQEPTRRLFLEAAAASLAGVLWRGDRAAAQPPDRSLGKGEIPAPVGPADIPVSLKPTGADLGRLYADVERLARLHDFEYSFLGGRFRDFDEFKRRSREKVLEVLLYRPRPVDPAPEVLSRTDLGDVIREKVVFSTTPEFRVPAYVHIPKGLTGPAPAIVDLHSHGGMFIFGKEKVTDLGNNHPVMQEYHRKVYDGRPTGTALAKRGYVVISIDAFMFGERRTILDADLKYGFDRSRYSVEDVRYLNAKCRAKEATLVKSLIYAGMTWPGIVVWDDIRTVDYLLTRPEVDPKRIGCNGISLGGYRSLFLAGLDERIAAANVVGFMSTVKSMIHARIDTHSWVHFPPTLHRYLDLPDVVSMMAPKPLLVQQCEHDGLFTLQGMKDAVAKIAAIYEKAGAKGRFTGRFYDTLHRFTRQMQEDAFAFFDEHLKG
ncbi:MAG: prolyl oligopeptidase family serine peptidase [Planctomycetes bacterium]|nr:prolyl oligopeptidase family serine peptidase [Planctomycetota bacterium]